MNICRFECLRLELTDSSILICNSLHFLLLDARWGDVHTKNDIFGFAHGQTGHINVVFLGVVSQDQVFKLHFDMNPLLVSQCRPNVMGLCHYGLVWCQDDFRSFWMQM